MSDNSRDRGFAHNNNGTTEATDNEEENSQELLESIGKHYAAMGQNIVLPGNDDEGADEEGDLVPTGDSSKEENSKEIDFGDGTSAPASSRGERNEEELGIEQKIERTASTDSNEVDHPGVIDAFGSQPGAYAESSGVDRQASGSGNGDGEEQVREFDSNVVAVEEGQTESQDLPQAETVQDEEGRIPDLQQAVSVDETQRAQVDADRKNKFIRSMVLLSSGALTLIAVVVVLLLVLPKRNSDSPAPSDTATSEFKGSPTASPSSYSTAAPTSALEAQVLSLFPNHTLLALGKPGSAQSKALQWLLDDPWLPSYVTAEWRVRQRFALASVYYATKGTDWTWNNRWLSYDDHECSWASNKFYYPPAFIPPAFLGLRVYSAQHNNPCGQSPEIVNASVPEDSNSDEAVSNYAYKHLWLYSNNLQGSIPEELFWLTSLKSINLQKNSLEGTLSSAVGQLSSLKSMDIFRSGVTGTLPTEIGVLSNLFAIAFVGNKFSGTIPTEIGKLTKLESLMLDQNGFTGPIPNEFSILTKLTILYLSKNSLTGTLPTGIGRLELLHDFHVFENNLTGTLPSEMGLLPSVLRFGVFNNSFTGTISTELGLMSSISAFELNSNQFSGSIPSELGSLPNLTQFFVNGNKLTGTVPSGISNLLHGPTARLLAFSVADNPLAEAYSEDELCWVNSTFYPDECTHNTLFAMTCICSCECPIILNHYISY